MLRIADPRAVPVIGTDHHLPALPAEALTAHAVRARFLRQESFVPEFAGDGRAWGLGGPRSVASVLVPLVERAHGLHVLLTRRTDHLKDHAGQISFPGGRGEAADADAVATALREAHEEVGLPASAVQVIGTLPTYVTITQFEVTPVVALVSPQAVLSLDPYEVAEAFEVPLAYLMTPAHHQRHAVSRDGVDRAFLSMPWTDTRDGGTGREYFIWGATAAMLRNLYRFLAA